jgi:hypothetical protein
MGLMDLLWRNNSVPMRELTRLSDQPTQRQI